MSINSTDSHSVKSNFNKDCIEKNQNKQSKNDNDNNNIIIKEELEETTPNPSQNLVNNKDLDNNASKLDNFITNKELDNKIKNYSEKFFDYRNQNVISVVDQIQNPNKKIRREPIEFSPTKKYNKTATEWISKDLNNNNNIEHKEIISKHLFNDFEIDRKGLLSKKIEKNEFNSHIFNQNSQLSLDSNNFSKTKQNYENFKSFKLNNNNNNDKNSMKNSTNYDKNIANNQSKNTNLNRNSFIPKKQNLNKNNKDTSKKLFYITLGYILDISTQKDDFEDDFYQIKKPSNKNNNHNLNNINQRQKKEREQMKGYSCDLCRQVIV